MIFTDGWILKNIQEWRERISLTFQILILKTLLMKSLRIVYEDYYYWREEIGYVSN